MVMITSLKSQVCKIMKTTWHDYHTNPNKKILDQSQQIQAVFFLSMKANTCCVFLFLSGCFSCSRCETRVLSLLLIDGCCDNMNPNN
jgi:hypothetical protein